VTIRRILGRPAVFHAFNVVIGAPRAREIVVRDHVRARPGQRVLDIGCGTGEIVPFLPDVEYDGFDESADYIRAACAHYPTARFSCARIDSHAICPESFDLALAIGVLHHLNDVEALELLRVAYASLRPGGRLITLDGCYVDGQSLVSRWLLAGDRGRYVRARDAYLQLMRSVFPEITTVVRTDLLRVPYTHFIAECTRV
jgi:SAM-dependent methyltransferase